MKSKKINALADPSGIKSNGCCESVRQMVESITILIKCRANSDERKKEKVKKYQLRLRSQLINSCDPFLEYLRIINGILKMYKSNAACHYNTADSNSMLSDLSVYSGRNKPVYNHLAVSMLSLIEDGTVQNFQYWKIWFAKRKKGMEGKLFYHILNSKLLPYEAK